MKKYLLFSILASTAATAQVANINEDFTDFPAELYGEGGVFGHLPYNDWSASDPYPKAMVSKHSTTGNKYLKAYSFFDATAPITFFSPELFSIEGNLSFYASTSGGSLQVGVVSSPTDMESFVLLEEVSNDSGNLSRNNVSIGNIPNAKHIAFKYIPNGAHKVFGVDNVVFTPAQASNKQFAKENIILYTSQGILNIQGGNYTQAQIYTTNGSLLIDTKLDSTQKINVDTLPVGVYIVQLYKENREVVKTKVVIK